VKATYVGPPGPLKPNGECMTFLVNAPMPTNLPKELPAMPQEFCNVWTVLIGGKQWRKVEAVLKDHPDENQLICEGRAVVVEGASVEAPRPAVD
jgi:hypothetical protein